MLTDEFRKAKSPSIEFEGKTVLLFDTFPVPPKGSLLVRFNSVNSEWRQGIRLGDMSMNTDLKLTAGGQTAPGLQLWQDTCPAEIEVDIVAPQENLTVYNIWDPGTGQANSQIMGAGMHFTLSEDCSQRIYMCNDGHPEPSFEHLSFSLEIL